MSEPKVSIVVPVYNAEKYLSKCLDSIIAQTYTYWEAILVDDGSPDNCGKICDEYASKDNRFKVIHQPNGGVSVARQTGLDNATGDYIIHCDPDDWIEPTMLEEMLNYSISQDADMVICDIIEEQASGPRYFSQHFDIPISAKDVQGLIINNWIFGSLWNKLVKASCIKKTTFSPSNISYCEDTLFNVKVLNQDIKVVHLAKAFYHYNQTNTGSICHSYNASTILSRGVAISEIEKIVDKEKFNNMYVMKRSVLDALFLTRNFKELKTTYTEIHKEIINNHKKYKFFIPLGYFLSKALKGNPVVSYTLYKYNLAIIQAIKWLRKKRNNKPAILVFFSF